MSVKVGNGFTKEHAAEAPEEIPLIGPNAGVNPVEGTTEDLGDLPSVPSNSDDGDGAGANNDSLGTTVGGATRGGNSCDPAESFKIHLHFEDVSENLTYYNAIYDTHCYVSSLLPSLKYELQCYMIVNLSHSSFRC